jgi:hypothetical protein
VISSDIFSLTNIDKGQSLIDGWVEFYHGDNVLKDNEIKFIFYIHQTISKKIEGKAFERYYLKEAEMNNGFKQNYKFQAYSLVLGFAGIQSISYNISDSVIINPVTKPNMLKIKYQLGGIKFNLNIFIPLIGNGKEHLTEFVSKVNDALSDQNRVKMFSDIKLLLRLNDIETTEETYKLTEGNQELVNNVIKRIKLAINTKGNQSTLSIAEKVESLNDHRNSVGFIEPIPEDMSSQEEFENLIDSLKVETSDDYEGMHKLIIGITGGCNTREAVLSNFLASCTSNVEMFKANYEVNQEQEELKAQVMMECHDDDLLAFIQNEFGKRKFFKTVLNYLSEKLQAGETIKKLINIDKLIRVNKMCHNFINLEEAQLNKLDEQLTKLDEKEKTKSKPERSLPFSKKPAVEKNGLLKILSKFVKRKRKSLETLKTKCGNLKMKIYNEIQVNGIGISEISKLKKAKENLVAMLLDQNI